MVKNVKGGSNHKKFARKNLGQKNFERTRLKDKDEPCEMYGIVTTMFGQGVCEVRCNDGEVRKCIIRKKFSGRNKQSNIITANTIVLVGIRNWELRMNGKKEKCDLLEVYNNNAVKDIKKDPNANWTYLSSDYDGTHEIVTDKFDFDYNDDEDESEDDENKIDLDDI